VLHQQVAANGAPSHFVIPAPLASEASKRESAGTHMWTAPCLQDLDRGVRRIGCDHMSGLLSRSHMTAAEMVFATRGPNTQATSRATGSHGLSRVLRSIDHTNCSVTSKLPAFPAERATARPVPAKRFARRLRVSPFRAGRGPVWPRGPHQHAPAGLLWQRTTRDHAARYRNERKRLLRSAWVPACSRSCPIGHERRRDDVGGGGGPRAHTSAPIAPSGLRSPNPIHTKRKKLQPPDQRGDWQAGPGFTFTGPVRPAPPCLRLPSP
jgi:hypothetical protein